jgi:hypothetical protein
MTRTRHPVLLRFACAAALLLVTDCGTSDSTKKCAVGTEGCACTSGGACDPGLVCLSGLCVDREGGNAAAGADPGTAGSDGSDQEESGGAASSEESTGGEDALRPGDDSGAPGTAGSSEPPDDQEPAGSSGSPGTIAAAGAPAAAGGAGPRGTAGTVGTAGAVGAAGAPGAAGAAGAAPAVTACSGSDDCADSEICLYDVDGKGTCVAGSNQPCSADLTCIKDMGLLPVTGIEGDICQVAGDCGVDDGHIVGVCVDKSGDGSERGCVPICQYADDPDEFACVTHPLLGVQTECTRTNARVYLAVAKQSLCASAGSLESIICESPASADSVTSDFEWTLACTEQAASCADARRCFTNGIGPDPNATQSLAQFFDSVEASGTSYVITPSGGSGLGDACGTDCDCGHCNYCESGTCRYGGEGPYGCYRGCS